MRSTLATLVALAVTGTASANITVTGNGKTTYVPNLATVSVTVSSDAPTAAEAWQKNGQAVKKLFDVIKSFGINEKDFKTAGLNISPRHTHSKDAPPRVVGYTASYDLSITVRELKKVGSLLDALVANGANRGVGISFGTDRPDDLLDQARLQAVAEARRKAEQFARGAGAGLGHVVSISEGGAASHRFLRFEHAAPGAADALVIAAGQQELTVSVTVTFAIRNS